ncbi:nicotinate (nicotinamide) nucleotide adenylyltransferase [Aliidiomarina taiwanensis]|nr:nicotinate (nicotinamide) nucleotide adenylyltransferase [Aliidiomarina taiwanensis]
MTSTKPRLAFLGGTFDPVHRGHIEPLITLADTFQWQQVHLLPTCQPPHRAQPEATNAQRLAMLEAVAARDPRLLVNDWEIRQGKPSRTHSTLSYFRDAYPDHALYFVMGMDSWVTLHTWLQWQELNQHADLVILPRPGYHASQAAPEVTQWMHQQSNIHFPQLTETNVSATALRQQLQLWQSGQPAPSNLFPETFSYIQSQKLYR